MCLNTLIKHFIGFSLKLSIRKKYIACSNFCILAQKSKPVPEDSFLCPQVFKTWENKKEEPGTTQRRWLLQLPLFSHTFHFKYYQSKRHDISLFLLQSCCHINLLPKVSRNWWQTQVCVPEVQWSMQINQSVRV